MLKQNKGITLSVLVLTVILLLILTGVSLVAGTGSIKEIRIGRIISNMTLLQTKIQEKYEEYQFNGAYLTGQKVDKDSIQIDEVEEPIIEESPDMWYKWGKDELKELGFDSKMLGNNEFYLVNYGNNEVYYSKATRDNYDYYHTLTGLKSIYHKDRKE